MIEIFKKMDWTELVHEYKLDGKRLLPWENWSMPFGGAWCVVRSKSESLKHLHDEQEMFVIVSGNARVHVGTEVFEAQKGDFIAIPPGKNHYVENVSDTDFHFFTIWWEESSCKAFLEGKEKCE